MEKYSGDSDELRSVRHRPESHVISYSTTRGPGRPRRRVSWSEYRQDARSSPAAARLKVYTYLLDLVLQGAIDAL
jgi:hypothetical protein